MWSLRWTGNTVRWLLATLLAASLLAPAHAQTTAPAGAIQGMLTDPSGSPIAGAKILAQHQDTGQTRESVSDEQGRFSFTGLPLGFWRLHVVHEGFTTLDTTPLQVGVGQVVAKNLTLTLAGIAERIEVRERPEAIEAAATTASEALGGEQIEETPAASRNYMNFVIMAPGAAPTSAGGRQRSITAQRSPSPDSGFSFAGMRPRNNGLSVDGLDNRDETTGGIRVVIGLEMVEEFRVASAVTGAELGGASGGLINVVTRTGVNLWHGDFTFFGQNTALNARKPEVESATRPRFVRYQPGFSWYGPLRRNRTFFATAVELERESGQEWNEVSEEAAQRVNAALASWRASGLGVESLDRGLFDIAARGGEAFAKLNHTISASDTLAVRFAASRGRERYDVQGPSNFQDRSAGGSSLTTDLSTTANWFHIASPHLVFESRFQISQRRAELAPNVSSGPMIDIPGVISFGQGFRLNAHRTEDHWQGVESVDWITGRHRLSFGADIHGVQLDASLADRYAGIFVFPTLSSFEKGEPALWLQSFGDPRTRMSTLPFGSWIQERWQAAPALSVEAGLRFDRQRMPAGIPAAGNEWSPRLGLSWRPWRGRPTVGRIGAGGFYDRFSLAYLNEALQNDGVHGFDQFASGDAAAAIFSGALLAPIIAPVEALSRSGYFASARFPASRAWKVTAGFETALNSVTTFTVQGIWTRGLHLPRLRNAALRLPPEFVLEQTARSSFRGLSTSLRRRWSERLTYLVSYDLGRTLDDSSDFTEQPMNPANIRADWGRSRQDQRHRLAASALWEIPAPEKKGGRAEWFFEVIDEWTLAPVFTAGSGRPVNALLTWDPLQSGAYPLTARPAGVPRDSYLTPATVNLDVRLMKTIPFHENRSRLQFGFESFNLLNHPQAALVSEFRASAAGPLGSFGHAIESGNARQVQFFAQLEY
jgi:hypothetical protein